MEWSNLASHGAIRYSSRGLQLEFGKKNLWSSVGGKMCDLAMKSVAFRFRRNFTHVSLVEGYHAISAWLATSQVTACSCLSCVHSPCCVTTNLILEGLLLGCLKPLCPGPWLRRRRSPRCQTLRVSLCLGLHMATQSCCLRVARSVSCFCRPTDRPTGITRECRCCMRGRSWSLVVCPMQMHHWA